MGQVETGRVVAAGVKQHHIAFWRVFQRFEHCRHVELVVAAHVGVVADLQPGSGKDGFMDRPRRIAQPDTAARQALRDKVGAQAQRTGAARGLGGSGTFARQQRRILAQYQLGDQLPKAAVAMTADVRFGQLLVHQALFGLFDRLQDRRQAIRVLVDAHAQVELVRVAVLLVGIHQTENRVARHPTYGVEVHYLRPSAVFATSSVRAAMMKSLRCRPLIEWLHQVTVTEPHSVSRPG